MQEDRESEAKQGAPPVRGFVASFVTGLVRDLVKFVVAFAVGTGAGAIACWYYGLPMMFSLLGGILVVALALVFMSDSLF